MRPMCSPTDRRMASASVSATNTSRTMRHCARSGLRPVFAAPAYPLENVFDPTGAGDTFAGGFMGYLAQQGLTDRASVRRAMVFGAVMASFAVEDFSLERLKRLARREIEQRYAAFQGMVSVEQ